MSNPMNLTLSRPALTAVLAGAGVLHFLKPQPFDRIVPGWVPGSARRATYLSGAAELAIAAGLSHPTTRKHAAKAAAALFVAVFPGNIEMARQWVPQSHTKAAISLLRLPLQATLIQSALKIAR
ncbi:MULTISPECIES: hypothetical protein [unclassified Corynebacterium]|uniref:DoxX family protein n=1 Tax=unclassified Corynebacterium TaxID=2624378 RepID=UPI0029C9D216|nr:MULTISPECIES: hypothetical protein [unclassified Corynebacterium]WPF66910.1 hypothetical protein OLX12_04080 [Corynebacterium sp. 22KM0430]WPF69397.1 hypothetical protein OLW90_04075 [Corynebacterium sp. 21KM1197]